MDSVEIRQNTVYALSARITSCLWIGQILMEQRGGDMMGRVVRKTLYLTVHPPNVIPTAKIPAVVSEDSVETLQGIVPVRTVKIFGT